MILDEHFEHFNEAELASGEMGDFFRLGPKISPEKHLVTNGLSDDVFLDNSIGKLMINYYFIKLFYKACH